MNRADYLGLTPEECDPDSDEYDDANCQEIMDSLLPIYDLEEMIVVGLDEQEIRKFYSGFGPLGDELLADIIDDYNNLAYDVDDSQDNGVNSSWEEEIIDEDLLKELCGSEEGRALVDRINNESINIYTSETAFTSIRQLGFFNSTVSKGLVK